jgi:DNA-binding NarL/FixJ family response regulator
MLVDDHPLFREGLSNLIMGLDACASVEQVGSLHAALALQDKTFHLILLDLNLPHVEGLDGLTQMKSTFPDSPIVVISADDDPQTIAQAIHGGASGFIPKSTNVAVTKQAIQLVMAHGVYLPPQAIQSQGHGKPPEHPLTSQLSARQLAVLRGLLQGKPNKVIARDIGIAEGTVKAHLWTVYQLLGVSNRAQAMYRAHELQLFQDRNGQRLG